MPRATTETSEAPTAEATTQDAENGSQRRRSGPALNRVELIGRLAADPELRSTSSGVAVARLRVATNATDTVEYHDVVVWRQVAEFAAQFLSTGRLVFVEGRLHSRSWEGQDGTRRRTTEVIASSLQALSPRGTDAEASS
jgi:single-strand DNA-binding protein